jgi:hypothetical protein
MRNHRSIIAGAGGVTPLRKALATLGVVVEDPTVRSWERRGDGEGSIPPEYWPSLVRLGFATLEELSVAAEARKFPDLAETGLTLATGCAG